MEIKAKPLGDRVLIQPNRGEEVSAGGIIIPETHHDATKIGKVVAVGQGLYTSNGHQIPMEIKVGDMVMYPKASHEIQLDGEAYIVMRESEVIMIV